MTKKQKKLSKLKILFTHLKITKIKENRTFERFPTHEIPFLILIEFHTFRRVLIWRPYLVKKSTKL